MPIALALLAACHATVPDPDGGPPLDVDAAFTDDAGLTGDYRLIVPDGTPDAGRGVLLFFTWDGGGRHYDDEAAAHVDVAAAHGLIVVSLRNPDDPPGNACWWTPEVVEYAAYVDQLLQDVVIGPYGVDPHRVFLTGLSGGSDFAAAFLYHVGYAYQGGSVALCGGDVPRLDGGDCDTEADPPAAPAPTDLSAEVLEGVRYDYAIDEADPLYEASLASAAFYEDAGFTHVTHRVVPGYGHCAFENGFEGPQELADGLDLVDPLVTP